MSISVQEKDRLFLLRTEHTEYQMAVDRLGVLRHLWYGRSVDASMAYLQEYPDVGFSGSPYDAGDERSYSLDTLPQEYACEGSGDFRLTALSVRRGDGARAVDLRYAGYEVKEGKPALPGLPCARGEDAQTLEITLTDPVLGLRVALSYGVYEQLDVITRSAAVFNDGPQPLTLEKAASLCLDLPRQAWQWVHFHGRHMQERLPERAALLHGIQESASLRGISSHQHNPAVLLCAPDCGETGGECLGAMLVYSGSFQTQVELDQLEQVRLVMGLHPGLFQWRLEPGERFDTPEALLSFSAGGFERLSHQFHRFIRRCICRPDDLGESRGVLVNSWEAAYFDFNEEKLCAMARSAARLGLELLVLDDGWFGKRDSDSSSLGDWTVNRKKLPNGLDGLAEKLKALRMKLGLWLEPEMVSEDSELYRAHPDWALRIPGRGPVRGRYQLVLDLSRREVEDYLFDTVSGILSGADIVYVKWDMNRSICDWYSACLPPERMGELPHRYMLGLYSLLERLTQAYPDVLFEGCCGGGGRFDAGMLRYFPQIWCSDDTDAYERARIQYGTSFFYPISAVGSHVSAVPNHQTGRVTPLEARAAAAMAGTFGYELDVTRLSGAEKRAIKAQVETYKAYRPLIRDGLYYRLSDPLKEDWAGWQFVSEDRSRALVQGMVFRARPNSLRRVCRLRGLDPARRYCLEGDSQVYTGAALMYGGVLLSADWGDCCPFELAVSQAEE